MRPERITQRNAEITWQVICRFRVWGIVMPRIDFDAIYNGRKSMHVNHVIDAINRAIDEANPSPPTIAPRC